MRGRLEGRPIYETRGSPERMRCFWSLTVNALTRLDETVKETASPRTPQLEGCSRGRWCGTLRFDRLG
jgi:hypothetical protein